MIETKYKDIYIEDVDVYKKMKDGSFHKLCKWIDNLGYYMVLLKIDGKKIYKRIHRLIAETLLPNPDNLPQVNHIDGNKLNNALDNLEFCDNAYNTKEAYDSGLYKSKTRCEIIASLKSNPDIEYRFRSIRKCSETLKLNRKTITSILKGEKKTNNYPYYFRYA